MKKLIFVFVLMAGIFACEKQPEQINGTGPNVENGVKPMVGNPAYWDYHCEQCGWGACSPMNGGAMYYTCPSCGAHVCGLGSPHPCLVQRSVKECPF